MAIADTITSMQNHTSNAYTMIGYGTDLTGINKNLENLSTSIFNAFLEALRTPDTLFTNLPKKSGSGSVITLNDTANAPMRIELSASEITQDGTPTPSSPQVVHTISGSNKVVVESKNQLTGNWEQGTFSYVENTNYSDENRIRTTKFAVQPSTEYTFSCNSPLGEIAWIFYQENGTTYIAGSSLNTTGTTATITTPNNAYYMRIRIGNGTYPKTYTTDYHQRLDDDSYISQEAEVDLGYENLAKFPENCLLPIPTTWTIIDFGEDKTFDNLTITMFMENALYTNASAYIVNLKTDGGTNNYIMPGNFPGWNANTLLNGKASVIKQNITFRYAYVGTSVNFTQGKMSIQIEEGNVAHNYTPYGKQIEYCKIGNYEDKIIRTSGKNKLDNSKIVKGRLDNGVIGYESNTTALTYTDNSISFTTNTNYRGVVSDFIPIEASDYIFFAWGSATTSPACAVNYYDENKTFISANSGYQLTNALRYPNAVANAKYIRLYISLYTAGTQTITYPQVRFNSDIPEYEPYGSNEWYIKKNIGKVVLDGTEGWLFSASATSPTNRSVAFLSDLITFSMTNYKSNYFIKDSTTSNRIVLVAPNGIYVSLDDTLTGITSGDTNAQKLGKIKTWLGTHNTLVYYPLATPTYTQITGTLANQLENIYQKLLSYSGTTNISQINNDLSFNLSVSAIEE